MTAPREVRLNAFDIAENGSIVYVRGDAANRVGGGPLLRHGTLIPMAL